MTGTHKMKLGLLTAIWGRPRLTELVLRYYEQFDLSRYLVFTESDLDSLPEAPAWFTFSHENEPLSDKWAHGIESARDYGDDGIMIVGSDDLVTPKYIEACKYLLAKGVDYIYMPGCYFYNAQSQEMIWGNAHRLGLGRVLSRNLLDRLNWKLWDEGLQYGLDGNMWDKVRGLEDVKIFRLTPAMCRTMGMAGVDIKTGDNIWSYDHVKSNLVHEYVKADVVLDKFFPSVKEDLLNWSIQETIQS